MNMPLTLEEYADHLDTRTDLTWPAPPEIERPKAKPHLVRLPGVRAVTWSVYGTLLTIAGGELYLEHPNKFIMDVALDKTIHEFKMWKAMTRKPGQPADYMRLMYQNVLAELNFLPTSSERHPEIQVEKVWENIIKKLQQNEYTFNAASYGSLDDYSRKIAYFFHLSLQGTACYAGTLDAVRRVQKRLGHQGLLANGQCFTPVQLARGLRAQGATESLEELFPPALRVLSHEVRARKPSERIYREMLARLNDQGLAAAEVLHVGSSMAADVIPARRFGMKVALFAGDKASLHATPGQLKQAATRPDVLLTSPEQIEEVI
jgi:FMN phosphatase YigB (HAD superfamily)